MGTPATPGRRGSEEKWEVHRYVLRGPLSTDAGHTARPDQSLPLATFQAVFKPNERAAQKMLQTPRVSSQHGVLTQSPHTPALSQALAPHGRVAANPCAGLILIA